MSLFSESPLHGQGRQRLRSLKRLARAGSGADAAPALKLQSQAIALALLDRSILFKHRRLALLRLKEAVELGAAVNTEQWTYCRSVMTLKQNGARRAEIKRAAKASRANRVGKTGPL